MGRFSATRSTSLAVRFFDNISTTGNLTTEAMTPDEKAYSVINNAHTSNSKTVNVNTVNSTLTFVSTSLATPPSGFPAQTTGDFTIFINGVAVENDAVHSVTGSGVNVVVTFSSSLNYDIDSTDEYMLTGKVNA